MKSNLKSKKFSETVTLNVNVKDAEGNPVDESKMTQEQINFCAQVASKKYKKFSASEVKPFDEEVEAIDVVLPENIEDVDIDAIAEEAAIARDAASEVVTEVYDEPTEVEEFCDKVKEFSATIKSAKKFNAEELAEIQEDLAEIAEAVAELKAEEKVEEEEQKPEEVEEVAAVEEVKEFCAKVKTMKFSAEDLEEVKALQEELTKAVAELENPEEPENPNPEDEEDTGVAELKQFTAQAIDNVIGEDSVSSFKSKFFAAKK